MTGSTVRSKVSKTSHKCWEMREEMINFVIENLPLSKCQGSAGKNICKYNVRL